MKRRRCPAVFLLFFPSQGKKVRRQELWGYIQGTVSVYGLSLGDRQRYQELTDAKQLALLHKKLLFAKKKQALVCGLPRECRGQLQGKAPVVVADGRPLSVVALLQKAETEWKDIKGKDISLEGVDGMWALGAVDYLTAAGAWLSLEGAKAQQVAKAIYAKRGVVLPVGGHSTCRRLCLFPGEDVPGQVFHLADFLVPVAGDWLPACPYPQGMLPASYAAAVALAGEKPGASP